MQNDALIAFARALLRTPSPSGEERAVVELALAEMRRLGFDAAWANAEGTAVGLIVGSRPGPTLLFDAHCDTVGIAPGLSWEHDPFGAAIEGGYLYGRGAADMKGAFAAMVLAAGAIDRTHLAGRVAVCASVMEENLEGAALKTVIDELKPGFVVIGEATDLRLNRGGRGRAEIHLTTTGRPAHSSQPHLGRNAVHDMIRVVQGVEALSVPSDPFLGRGIFALTDIISEPYPAYSVLPSQCRVTYDRRLLAGETAEGVLASIRELPGIADIQLDVKIAQGEHRTYTGAFLTGPKFLPAWLYDEDEPFVQVARRALLAAGLQPEFGAYRFCTNAAYSAGTVHIPTVGFGPGREEDAHILDERVPVADLLAAAKGYQGIMEATLAGG